MSRKSRARFKPRWTGKAIVVSSQYTEDAHWGPSKRYDEWYSRAEVHDCCEEHSFRKAPIRDDYASIDEYLAALDEWESVLAQRDDCPTCKTQKSWYETVWNSPDWWLS